MEGVIPSSLFGLIELGLVFGAVLLFCGYQIWSVRRAAAHARATARETAARDAAGGDPVHGHAAEDDAGETGRDTTGQDARRGIR